MTKNLYVKGYGERRPERRRLFGKRTAVFGIIVVAAVASWLLLRKWEHGPQHKSLPELRHRIVGRVPPGPLSSSTGGESGLAAGDAADAAELRFAMEARVPAPIQQTGDGNSREAEEEKPQAAPGAEIQAEETSSEPGQDSGEQEIAVAGHGVSKPSRETAVVIQVGAFRSVTSAEKLKERLQQKGYEAYLDARVLKRRGLLHRVRIRGYASVAAAENDKERLEKEEGLKPLIFNLET